MFYEPTELYLTHSKDIKKSPIAEIIKSSSCVFMVNMFELYVPVYESSAFYTFEIYKYLCRETSNKLPLQTKRDHLTG